MGRRTTSMRDAVARGDLEAVEGLVLAGFRVDRIIGWHRGDSRDEKVYYSSLYLASREGHTHVVSWLIAAGAHHGRSPEPVAPPIVGAFACQDPEKGLEIFRLFPEHDELLRDRDLAFRAARAAAAVGALPLLRLVVAVHGVALPLSTRADNSCVHVAAAAGQLDVINFLIQCIKDERSNRKEDDGVDDYVFGGCDWDYNYMTPLLYACEGGHADVANALIDAGNDVTYVENDGETALSFAIRSGSVATVNVVVECLIFEEARHANQEEAMKDAVESLPELAFAGAVDALALFALHLRVEPRSDEALACACFGGRTSMARSLMERGSDPLRPLRIRWSGGSRPRWWPWCSSGPVRTPLFEACRGGHEKTVRAIIEDRRVSGEAVSGAGIDSPLCGAASSGNASLVRYLVEEVGVVAALPDGDVEDTALHAAVRGGHGEIARYLVERAGMDPNRPLQGERDAANLTTPVGVARTSQHPELIAELVAVGADAPPAPKYAENSIEAVLRKLRCRGESGLLEQLRAVLLAMSAEQRGEVRFSGPIGYYRDLPEASYRALALLLLANCPLVRDGVALPADREVGVEVAQALATNSMVERGKLRLRVLDGHIPAHFARCLALAARAVNLKELAVDVFAQTATSAPLEGESDVELDDSVWLGAPLRSGEADAAVRAVIATARPIVAALPRSSTLRVVVANGDLMVWTIRTVLSPARCRAALGGEVASEGEEDDADAEPLAPGTLVRVRGDPWMWRVVGPAAAGGLEVAQAEATGPEGGAAVEVREVQRKELAVARPELVTGIMSEDAGGDAFTGSTL